MIGPRGITANGISPGAAVFLTSDAASYVNGHILVVDGGATILM